MLNTASDAHFDDIAATTFMFTGALVGPIRLLLEGKSPQSMIRKLHGQLESLCLGYLEREASPKVRPKRSAGASQPLNRSRKTG